MNLEVGKEQLLERLNQITKGMDVPVFRRMAPKWLSQNLGIRNSKHKDYAEAVEIIRELLKIGM